ncbi:MAG: hypothetical protein GY950_02140 [bacterium]|nr:hypothetical protein [bacterium]
MGVKKKDHEFRAPKVSFLEFKVTEMERVLTMLFPRLKFDGRGSRKPPRADVLQADEFAEEILKDEKMRPYFKGFERHPFILKKWIETDLLDVVNRGKADQAVASPRPLHGDTYKFRNARRCRDYGAAEQLYWMLYYARGGKGEAVRALKKFFFPDVDPITNNPDTSMVIDVETQALLRFNAQVEKDLKDSREPERVVPLCIGQADLLADDVLRLLAYEPYIPRSVLVDYLKTLFAFHLSLYHLKLLKMLPRIVKQQSVSPLCAKEECPANPGKKAALEGCPYRISITVDMGDVNNKHMNRMARKSADSFYRQIPAFVHANYIVKKLDEMAEYLSKKTGILQVPSRGYFTVSDLIDMLGAQFEGDREAYFKYRMVSILEGTDDLEPEIREITTMELDDFEKYIEILMAYRGQYHKKYITESIDSLLLKNKKTGLLAQSRTTGSPRRFVLGGKLLEVLLQLAVLNPVSGGFFTRELRIEELLVFLRERYGICVDKVPDPDEGGSIPDRRALRLNLETFKRRLREIGFYQDLSDAYITQKISPRYTIPKKDTYEKGRRQA